MVGFAGSSPCSTVCFFPRDLFSTLFEHFTGDSPHADRVRPPVGCEALNQNIGLEAASEKWMDLLFGLFQFGEAFYVLFAIDSMATAGKIDGHESEGTPFSQANKRG